VSAKPAPAIVVTGDDLKEIVKAAVREVLDEEPKPVASSAITEEGRARARRNLRRFGRGT
jgi:hypothetical protein